MRFSSLNNEKGSIVLIVALSITVIMGFAALVIDYGAVVIEKTKFQNAVDAVALSAANYLPSTSLATTKANNYIELNGYNPADISITFLNSNNTIEVTGTKIIQYGFARILGFNDVTITQTAYAERESVGEAFNYAMFSGGEEGLDLTGIELTGSNNYINGNVHTNSFFKSTGSSTTITGNIEAATTITISGSHPNINQRIPNSPIISMPSFYEPLKLEAEQNGTAYTGTKSFNLSNIDITHPIFVDGSINISGSTFSGKGCIIATGSISLSGSNTYQNLNSSVCFYSINGDINISGSSITIDGVLYAPNGTIKMSGSNKTINGRIVAKEVDISGSSLTLVSSENDLQSLPKSSVRLVNN